MLRYSTGLQERESGARLQNRLTLHDTNYIGTALPRCYFKICCVTSLSKNAPLPQRLNAARAVSVLATELTILASILSSKGSSERLFLKHSCCTICTEVGSSQGYRVEQGL